MNHFVIVVTNADGSITLTQYKESDLEAVCKFILADPKAKAFQAFPDAEDDKLFSYKSLRVLDPVLIDPPKPDPFLKYDVEVEDA